MWTRILRRDSFRHRRDHPRGGLAGWARSWRRRILGSRQDRALCSRPSIQRPAISQSRQGRRPHSAEGMLPVLRPRRLFSSPSSSVAGKGGPPVDAEAAAAARAEAYRQVQNFDWSSSADWKTAANILFTLPPKRKEFGLDFHLVQLFFVCMPSLAVYLVAQYARREIKRMEAEAEEKRKKEEEIEKQKQLEEESVKEDADSELSKVLVRLDTLEGVVKKIVDDKGKVSSSKLHTKEELVKKNETSREKTSDLKSSAGDSQVTFKSKDINGTANTPSNTTQPSSKGDGEKAQPKS